MKLPHSRVPSGAVWGRGRAEGAGPAPPSPEVGQRFGVRAGFGCSLASAARRSGERGAARRGPLPSAHGSIRAREAAPLPWCPAAGGAGRGGAVALVTGVNCWRRRLAAPVQSVAGAGAGAGGGQQAEQERERGRK